MSHPPRHWLLLATLVVIFGSAFLLIKIALVALSPPGLVFIRLVTGFLVVFSLALALRLPIPREPRILAQAALLGLVGNAMPFSLIAWGQQYVPSSVAGIFMAVMPITIVVLAHFFLPDEKLTARKAFGFVAAFFGIIVLIGPDAAALWSGESKILWRELAVLGGALCYSINTILTRRGPQAHPIPFTALVLFAGACWQAPFGLPAALVDLANVPVGPLAAAIAVGVFPTGLATIVYFVLIREAGASFFALTNYLVPVWAATLGWTLGGEAMGVNALVALLLILGGIALSQRGPAAVAPAPH